RGHTHTQAGEQARSEIDGDAADVLQVDARLAPDEVDRGRQVLGVALAAARMGLREDALVSADGDADLRGARVDPEDQHFSPSAFLRPRGERLAQRSGAGVPSR